MSIQISQTILVLDDDDIFRATLVDLLKNHGLEVISARSAREATALLGTSNPMLAIIDYRLPESDGITWITRLREAGKNFPVVFLSGIWCDEKTFDWLRNILRVSLILQKPIMPELFMQQIESLLPAGILSRAQDLSISSQNKAPADSSNTHAARASGRMETLRQEFANQLSQVWDDLKNSILCAQREPSNSILKSDAIHKAHKIRGSAGSFGYEKVGTIAGKLEDLLLGLDPDDPLSQVVWSEINRALTAGEDLIVNASNKAQEKSITTRASDQSTKILFIGAQDKFGQYANIVERKKLGNIEFVESVISARALLKTNCPKFAVAVLDFDCIGDKKILFDVIQDIRSNELIGCIPIGLILPESHKIKGMNLAYAGISVLINEDLIGETLVDSIAQLLSCSQSKKPNILLVDDDEVLSKYLREILEGEGMNTQALHKPIKIVSAAKAFDPDLVLLDVEMPGLSGYDVCRILRATEEWQHVPILFLTSKADQVSRQAAFQAGGNDFLSKPVVQEELLARVQAQIVTTAEKNQLMADQLTKVLTRNDFIESVSHLLKRAESENRVATVCLINVDDYMKNSFQHGWHNMQTVLSSLGVLLNGRFKCEDLRGRLSEETFALAFLGENEKTVGEIVNLLRSEFADMKFTSDNVGHFKTIFDTGIAEYPSDGSTITALFEVANQRLLNSKLQPSH